LDPEQDTDRVAPRQDPEETDREHECGQHQVGREPDHSSPRAKYRAPISAVTSKTPRSSNVIAKGPASARPIEAVVSPACSGRGTGSGAWSRNPAIPANTAAA